jgi:ABC-2 type transport system ATP-binding protein
MRLLRELIQEQHRNGATVIFSTHVMVQAEEICDHVVMIHDGNKVVDDTLSSIRARFDPSVVRFEPLDPASRPDRIEALPEVERVQAGRSHWEILLRRGTDPATAMARVVSAVTPARLELHRPTLEDVFIEIVTGGRRAVGAEDVERLRAAVRPDGVAAEAGSGTP